MVQKVTRPMKVGKKTVQVGLGAGSNGGIRRGVAPPKGMTMGAPKMTADPGIPKGKIYNS